MAIELISVEGEREQSARSVAEAIFIRTLGLLSKMEGVMMRREHVALVSQQVAIPANVVLMQDLITQLQNQVYSKDREKGFTTEEVAFWAHEILGLVTILRKERMRINEDGFRENVRDILINHKLDDYTPKSNTTNQYLDTKIGEYRNTHLAELISCLEEIGVCFGYGDGVGEVNLPKLKTQIADVYKKIEEVFPSLAGMLTSTVITSKSPDFPLPTSSDAS